jgi:hypothetical protein
MVAPAILDCGAVTPLLFFYEQRTSSNRKNKSGVKTPQSKYLDCGAVTPLLFFYEQRIRVAEKTKGA